MPPELDMTTSHVPSYLPTHDHIQKEETVRLKSRNLLDLVHAASLIADATSSHQWLLHLVFVHSLSSPKCIYSVKIGCASAPCDSLASIDESFCFSILSPAKRKPQKTCAEL
jgi:hypothetical protein